MASWRKRLIMRWPPKSKASEPSVTSLPTAEGHRKADRRPSSGLPASGGGLGKAAPVWPVRPHRAFTEEALRRAWRAVRANGGGAGVDGVDIAAFESRLDAELAALAQELSAGSYRPRAVQRIFVPKRNEGLRPLAIWTLRDRVAQRAVYAALEPLFEPDFLPCSHGFRPGRSVQTAVADVAAARERGLRWVLDTDIKDCFDSIDVTLLMNFIRRKVKDPILLEILGRWLHAGILTAAGTTRPAGIAQGGVLSPLLCNIYLHRFDQDITNRKLCLVRYADDLVVLCRQRQDAVTAQQVVGASLQRLRLQVNPYKTRVVSFDEGFKFLGVFLLRNEQFTL